MRNLIPERLAITGLLVILSLIVLFHALVLTGIIPFTIIGGGRITNTAQMIRLEVPALLVNLVLLLFVATRAGYVSWKINPTVYRVGFWIMFVLFVLNTLGNLLSTNTFERAVFTPLTILIAMFSLRLALPPQEPA